jgi:NMD protein affecting ribosome stability and mRNA decay
MAPPFICKKVMTEKRWSFGTCHRCGKQNTQRLWELCQLCCKSFEDEYGAEWAWGDKGTIYDIMLKMGYHHEKTTKE